jgi:hypothetical protein
MNLKDDLRQLVIAGNERTLGNDEALEFASLYNLIVDPRGESIETQLGINLFQWIDFVLLNPTLMDQISTTDRFMGGVVP